MIHRLMAAAAALAAVGAAAQVTVSEAWARATVPAQKSTGAYMAITSARDAKLVEVRSSAAGIVEIHEMSMGANNVMTMRAVPALDLPAGKRVELAPGGLHVMLMALKAPVKEGERLPLTLVVESGGKRETVEVQAEVKPLATRGGHTGHRH